MQVFKFGGASVNNIERIKNLASIIKQKQEQPLVVIISAMGKTTNGLEKVAAAFFSGNKDEALNLFDVIKNQHISNAKDLLVNNYTACYEQLGSFFTEVEWLLHDKPVRGFDYYYDQIVCCGELFSTCIVSHYLNEVGIINTWLDVRDMLRTDNNFRDANIDWHYSAGKIKAVIEPVLTTNAQPIFITQGFIGCTDENESTTLGREGSDYTAAIFANILNAKDLTIWKDVEGVMNADPKKFTDATYISELSFEEVIEMAYYGAQVIHPKTIKPIENKGIPLLVKCFLDPSLPGTIISKKVSKNLPPIIVVKEKQVLMHLHSQDFSFVGDEPMSRLYGIFGQLNIKPNLIQSGAISLMLCLDEREEKIHQLANKVTTFLDVQIEKGLELLTIRHYNLATVNKMMEGKEIVLTQRTPQTLQIVFRV